ncbi:uncharacterized protein [Physcomitrium patens]|uniref:uncharacterized protein isoform X2 n=1 Tax=Physcomitrium patens TaxID=3218 RepID=UPI003CCD4CDA
MEFEGMHLQVQIRTKINLWDWKVSNIQLPIGNGHQPFQWLGYVACNYIAFENRLVTSRCIPQGILVKGKLVDVERIIKDTCHDGENVIVEYSGGPEAYTQCWEGRISDRDKRERASLIRAGYDMGDNTEIYDLINEIDALVTKVVNLIHDVVIEVDEILHGNKLGIQNGEDGTSMDILLSAQNIPSLQPQEAITQQKKEEEPPLPQMQYQLDEEGNPLLDESGNPILLPPPIPDPPKDKETYMELALSIFEEWDYGIIKRIQVALEDMDGDLARHEFQIGREVMKAHDGQLQALLLWYSSKGFQLHDKDFGVLNFQQWQKLWQELNVPTNILDSSLINPLWYKMKDVGQIKGCYQLNAYGFYAAIMHLTLDLYTGYKSTPELSNFSEMIFHFLEDIIVPSFKVILSPKLKLFHEVDTSKHESVFKSIEETISNAIYIRHLGAEKKELDLAALKAEEEKVKAAKEAPQPLPPSLLPPPKKKNPNGKKEKKGKVKEPPQMEDKEIQVRVCEEVKNLIPYFRDVSEFTPLPTDKLTFGIAEFKRMMSAACHAAYMKVPIKRVSEFSFFQKHLNECFKRGGLAKDVYSDYKEKKHYLASICLRYGGKSPPQPPMLGK